MRVCVSAHLYVCVCVCVEESFIRSWLERAALGDFQTSYKPTENKISENKKVKPKRVY